MNKKQMIQAITEESSLTESSCELVLDATVKVITKELGKGGYVKLIGFGTFDVRSRAARTGRNPKTGETIQIKASKNPAFKPGKALKEAVNA